MPPYLVWCGAPGRTRTCGPLLSFQHQAFPDRPSNRGCWLDYILDVTVPTRIVSEDPSEQSCAFIPRGFLRITQSSWIFTRTFSIEVPEALRASPHTGSSTQWVPDRFPIKAPTRQMLYPLSYRGINVNGLRMLARHGRNL